MVRVDYTDVDALAAALEGHGAVVCVVGPGAISAAKGMVEAAVRAGVKRYISECFQSLLLPVIEFVDMLAVRKLTSFVSSRGISMSILMCRCSQ